MSSKQKSRKRVVVEDDGSDDNAAVSAKRPKGEGKSTTTSPTEMQRDKEGCEFWDITDSRRIQITNFKGTYMIAIREYYEKNGEKLPGKKGINLPISQFASLIEILPQIESILKEKDQDVPRPDYSGTVLTGQDSAVADNADEEQDEDEEKKEEVGKNGVSKLDKFKLDKKNHEATSDDED